MKTRLKRYFKALKKVGLKKGDLVHESEIFKLGSYNNLDNENVYEVFYNSIRKLIGNSNNLC